MTLEMQRLAGSLLIATLSLLGCGGGSPPNTPLPSEVRITLQGEAEPGRALQFATDLQGPLHGLDVRWSFGDGSLSADEPSPRHTFAEPGDYEVRVSISNYWGLRREATLQVPVRRFSLVHERLCSLPSGRGWCWQRPLSSGNEVSLVQFSGEHEVWAIGKAGWLAHSGDDGRTWTDRSTGAGGTVARIHMADATHGWAQVQGGLLLRTNDAGASWSPQVTGAPDTRVEVLFPAFRVLDAQTALAQGTDGRGWYTTDGGTTWSGTAQVFRGGWAPDGALFGFEQVGDEGVLARSTDRGASFTPVLRINNPWPAYFRLDRLEFGADGFAWAMSAASVKPTPGAPPPVPAPSAEARTWGISTDGGLSWLERKMPLVESLMYLHDLQGMTLHSDGTGWVSANHRNLHLRTFDGGLTWSAPPMPPLVLKGTLRFEAVQLGRGVIAISQGPRGPAYITRDHGTTWREFDDVVFPSRMAPDGALWSWGNGTAYRSTDDGQTWRQLLGPEPGPENRPVALRGLCVSGARNALAAAVGGWLLSSGDAGATWSARTVTPNYASFGGWAQLQCLSPTHVWAGFGETTLRSSSDAGLTWTQTSAPASDGVIRAWHALDERSVAAVLSDGRVFRSADGGITWAALASLSFPVRGLLFVDAQVGLAVGEQGQIARTVDGGASWSWPPSGTTVRLNRLVQAPGGVLWVGGEGGELLRSGDLGLTWSRVATPAAAELFDLNFSSATHGWAVGAAGTLWATTDGGQHWEAQRSGVSADLVSVAAADRYTAWVGTSKGGVLVTASGGR